MSPTLVVLAIVGTIVAGGVILAAVLVGMWMLHQRMFP